MTDLLFALGLGALYLAAYFVVREEPAPRLPVADLLRKSREVLVLVRGGRRQLGDLFRPVGAFGARDPGLR
ncbi:MAG: hypothetical protein EXR58_05110 [Chloroflexi bacterium]|nr:hypothetical protein [Chloroflexota bacterium]